MSVSSPQLFVSPPTSSVAGKQRISEGAEKLAESKDKAKQQVLGKIGEADRKVEEEAGKAKGGVLSWFGK